MKELTGHVRTMLSASLVPEVGLLQEPYTAGSGELVFRNSRRLAPGMLLCSGLTTFTVLDSDQTNVAVVAGVDGSPDDDLEADSIVLIRPVHTTWQIWLELTSTISELSAPIHGLYRIVEEVQDADPAWNTYQLGRIPIKMLRVRYLQHGSDSVWRDVEFESQPHAAEGPQVIADVPAGTSVHITYAAAFDQPVELDDDINELGMPDQYAQILQVGAARNLALATESRLGQPYSQGDPRRAGEVSMTHHVVIHDRLKRHFQDLVRAERSRLIGVHSYRLQMEQYGART
jgi:hypothetical protein